MILDQLFDFVVKTCAAYNIDESHGLGHSMKVYYYATEIMKMEPCEHELIVIVSAILHDMCDHKYIEEFVGMKRIHTFLEEQVKLDKEQITIILHIISTMSYSKVKEKGFPHLGKYQQAYHIVREADLLAAYDFDRCVIYQMMRKGESYTDSVKYANTLFENRVTKYASDGLLQTAYAKKFLESVVINYPGWSRPN